MNLVLYHCRDARSFRALWMLEELGLAYRLELLKFPPRVREESYLDLNPLGTVPLLVDGETRMTESSAICHYLATTHGGGRCAVASDEPAYGAYLNGLFFGEATLTFPQTLVLRYSRLEPEDRKQKQVVEDYTRWFFARLKGLAAMIDDNGFVAAGRFTAADISIGYALMLAEAIGLGDGLPAFASDYWARLKARDGFARAKAAQAPRSSEKAS
jgi:glutathione S-transferase